MNNSDLQGNNVGFTLKGLHLTFWDNAAHWPVHSIFGVTTIPGSFTLVTALALNCQWPCDTVRILHLMTPEKLPNFLTWKILCPQNDNHSDYARPSRHTIRLIVN